MKKRKKQKKSNIILILILIFITAAAIYVSYNQNNEIETIDTYAAEKSEVLGVAENIEYDSGEVTVVQLTREEQEEIEEEIKEIQPEIKGDAPEELTNEKKEETNVNQNEEKDNIVTANNTNTYYIKVNYTANVVTIYTKDSSGNYTVPVKAMICSTGSATPKSGKYNITSYKRRWNYLQGNVYGQYATQIVGNILFHSVPYTAANSSSLEYWEYDKLGTSASLGCVRLTVADAKWIYNNIAKGTTVEFYSDSNPGPLGKPSAKKISENTECRNWDPTDPEAGNPWKNVKKEEPVQIKNENAIKKENTNTPQNTTIENNTINNNEQKNTQIISNTVMNNIKENTVTNTITNNTTKDNTAVNNTNTTTDNKIKEDNNAKNKAEENKAANSIKTSTNN